MVRLPTLQPPRKLSRHDPVTSKSIQWPATSPVQVRENQRLRDRYASDRDGMTADELARAEILVARDERNKLKKKAAKPLIEDEATPQIECQPNEKDAVQNEATPLADPIIARSEPSITSSSSSGCGVTETAKWQTKRNTALRKKFALGRGKGTTKDELARYQFLMARDERKRRLRDERRMLAAAAAAAKQSDTARAYTTDRDV